MEVWKFGGTSVGSPQRMREVAELIHTGKQRWIVLSAVSGTTNKLVAFNQAVEANDAEVAVPVKDPVNEPVTPAVTFNEFKLASEPDTMTFFQFGIVR